MLFFCCYDYLCKTVPDELLRQLFLRYLIKVENGIKSQAAIGRVIAVNYSSLAFDIFSLIYYNKANG